MGSSENVQLYLAFLFLDKKKSEPVVCVTVHIHGSFHDESRDQSECTDGLGDCLRDVIGSFPLSSLPGPTRRGTSGEDVSLHSGVTDESFRV